MKKYIFFLFACFLLLFSVGCQQKSEEKMKEIPIVHENLTLEQLEKQATIPYKLPKKLPFEPVEIFAERNDYKDLYEKEEQVEEIYIHYIKTNRDERYLDVTVSNLEETPPQGESVPLSNGREATYVEDDVGQLLFWNEGELHYRLIYYTSDKVNEGQEPLQVEQFTEIANSFR
ncbi:hypothetical protein DCC39_13870 [Pueribacillus theae]|uniref:DUF4367 domain-containing protein n=1 Tax=Pueribacillus theae TaxID=2171751 RepID=A0A2U1JVR6_9BACI|nr:hypothetical protein [Pueribacillus theae]PWA09049.1 hypothetical protein DCC39_13870 [Pueribacillus theae]